MGRIKIEREIHVGEKIRQLRKRLGWTQEELAYRSQIDTSYLGQIEGGKKRSPTLRVIGKIADALAVDSSLLLETNEASTEDERGVQEMSNIPERVANELRSRSLKEQQLYYRMLKLLMEFNE